MTLRLLAAVLVVSVMPGGDARAQPADSSQPAEPLAPAVSQEPPVVDSSAVAPPADGTVATTQDKKKKKKKKKNKRLNVSGYVQVFYRYAFETGEDGIVDNDHFRVLRARLKAKGKLARKVRYVLEVDPRAPEITGIMRDAYLSLGYIPRHEVRIGQQKTLFGYENTESSTRLYAVIAASTRTRSRALSTSATSAWASSAAGRSPRRCASKTPSTSSTATAQTPRQTTPIG